MNEPCQIKYRLLSFGAWNYEAASDGIYEYDIIDNRWSTLQTKMPIALAHVACTSVLNGRFVLLFGGKDNSHQLRDNIYIYSVFEESIRESTIKCPEKAAYHAITRNDKVKDSLATFGFVRNMDNIWN